MYAMVCLLTFITTNGREHLEKARIFFRSRRVHASQPTSDHIAPSATPRAAWELSQRSALSGQRMLPCSRRFENGRCLRSNTTERERPRALKEALHAPWPEPRRHGPRAAP